MAFTPVVSKTIDVDGWESEVYGTFTEAPTSETIDTGLDSIDYCEVTGASALSATGGTITVTSSVTAGFWLAKGKRI